jgi:hypothetical protein
MKTRLLMSVAAAALLASSAVASAQGMKEQQSPNPAPIAQKAAPGEQMAATPKARRHVRRHHRYRHYYGGPYYGPYYGYYGWPAPFPFFPFAPWMW